MAKKNGLHCSTPKTKIALATLKGDRTITQIASEFRVHANLVYKWRKQLLEGAPSLFDHPGQTKTLTTDPQEIAQAKHAASGRFSQWANAPRSPLFHNLSAVGKLKV